MSLRFRDSATGDPNACAGEWFDEHLVQGVRAFRGQFGFFRFGALTKYASTLTSLAKSDRPVRFVLGSNLTDPLTMEDVESILSITDAGRKSTLTVVALRDALFHPKVAHVVRADGSAAAMVGSANFTTAALGANVEAWLEMSSSTDLTKRVLRQIERATDWWHTALEPGVFHVRSLDDARRLQADGLLISRGTQRRRSAAMHRAATQSGRGTRQRRWRPPADTPRDPMERESEPFDHRRERPPRRRMVLRWCKQLSASDALQTSQGTNPTGKLRLGQAGHDIDQTTWFRHVMFGDCTWIPVTRGVKRYEAAHIPFNVQAPRARFGHRTLLVDHAPHRAAGQHNVVTVLSWGPEVGAWLREHSQTGKWVSIELDDRGEYWLRLLEQAPRWAPRRPRRSRQRQGPVQRT